MLQPLVQHLIQLLTLLFCLLGSTTLQAEIFTLTAAESGSDPRTSYNLKLVTLALEKTRAEYGDYEIRTSAPMNTARALAEARAGNLTNLLVMTTFQNALLDQGLDYARFPVDFGVTGYRVCFVSPAAHDAIARLESFEDLRKYTIAQGLGWADVNILRHNRLTVQEVGSYESLFGMVAASRVDLFCRGINELEPELKSHEGQLNLLVDSSFALAYPLPRFFFSSARNGPALQRITRGMQRAYKDGSLRKLWLAEFRSALEFARLDQRRIFHLQNPDIGRIDFDYQKYYFDPKKPF